VDHEICSRDRRLRLIKDTLGDIEGDVPFFQYMDDIEDVVKNTFEAGGVIECEENSNIFTGRLNIDRS
jgi:hypothetical protein